MADATATDLNGTTAQGLKNDIHQLTQHIGRLQADLTVLAKDVGQVAKTGVGVAKEAAKHGYDSAKETAKHTYDATKETALHAYDAAREKGQEATDGLRNQVVKNPLTSVGIGVGVGIVLGVLFARSRD